MKIESKFWSLIGKISAIVILILTIIQIYQSVNSSKVNLSAICYYNDFIVPHFIKRKLNSISLQLKYNNIDSLLHYLERKSFKDITEYRSDFRNYLMFDFPDDEINDLTNIRSLCNIHIYNNSKIEISSIKLNYPDSGIFIISNENISTPFNHFNGNIDVGTIRPSNSINITIWSFTQLMEFDERNIKLTHPNGLIKIHYAKQLSGNIVWLSNNIYMIKVFIFLILFIIIISFIINYIINKTIIIDKIKTKPKKRIHKKGLTPRSNGRNPTR